LNPPLLPPIIISISHLHYSTLSFSEVKFTYQILLSQSQDGNSELGRELRALHP
jgi:hypothetical protein